MMSSPRLYPGFLILLLSIGCVSGGPPYAEYAESASAPAPGMGRIYIYRPNALPLVWLAGTRLNDVKIEGAVPPRSFFSIAQPDGAVRIRMFSGEEVSFPLVSGEIRYVRISVSHGLFTSGHMYPELVTSEVGRSEIQDLRLAAEVSGHQGSAH
jgi:hypothetical protein